jgi:hypothetical protein
MLFPGRLAGGVKPQNTPAILICEKTPVGRTTNQWGCDMAHLTIPKASLYGNGAARGSDSVGNWRATGKEFAWTARCLAAKRQRVGGGGCRTRGSALEQCRPSFLDECSIAPVQ